MKTLLADSISGAVWFSEPHLATSMIVGGVSIEISGAFCHRQCVRFCTNGKGFFNLTCKMCIQIPKQNDFKKRVIREDQAIEKRGNRTIAVGRRVSYFTIPKLIHHSRDMRQKLKFEKLNH